jgi:RimJ/RimL family protein N-acetyltransferase
MLDIPELTTPRLRMRGFESTDLNAYAEMMADPEVTLYISDRKPLTRAEAWRQMAIFTGHWVLRGYGIWLVEERATGKFLGRIGFWEPEGWPGFELAYTLARPFWGRGFAREGASAALTYAHDTLDRSDIISLIRPENAGSIRVAEALGAARARTIDLLGSPAYEYRYPSFG